MQLRFAAIPRAGADRRKLDSCAGRCEGDEVPRPHDTNRAAYQQVLSRRDGNGRSRNSSSLQREQMGKQVRIASE